MGSPAQKGPPRRSPVNVDAVLAAELRAMVEGHQARRGLAERGRFCFHVKSDSSDRTYTLWVFAVTGRVRVSCDCLAGQYTHRYVGCKHAARLCQRLEREGLVVRVEDGWVPRPRLVEAGVDSPPQRPRRPGLVCAGCGDEIDPDCVVPADLQHRRSADGKDFHRRCLILAVTG